MTENTSAPTPAVASSAKTEKISNVFLAATRPPSGSLQLIPDCAEMNALLAPEQAYLARVRIAPYFQLVKLRNPFKSTAEYTIYGHDDEQLFASPTPSASDHTSRPCTPPPPRVPSGGSAATSEVAPTNENKPAMPESKRYATRLTISQYEAVNEVLRQFVRHHVLVFDRVSGTGFVTAAGRHGVFSDVLDKVTVTSSEGLTAARVLGDLDPVNPLGSFMEHTRRVCCPASLPIFLTSRAVLAEDELQTMLVRLHTVVLNDNFPLTWSLDAQPSPPFEDAPHCRDESAARSRQSSHGADQLLQSLATGLSLPPPARGSDVALSSCAPSNPVAETAAPVHRYANAAQFSQSLRSEDLENDVTVEIDLTPFESKVEQRQRRSQLQAQHANGRLPSIITSAVTTGKPSSASPLPTTQGTAASGAAARDGRGPKDGVVKGTPVLGPSGQPLPTASSPTTAPSSAGAPRVLQHEYSRESIINYRKVVAADNEIHYREFQLLMEQPLSMPLAELLSMFVSEMQQQEHVFYDNKPVGKLRTRWATRLASIPLLASSERKTRILNEGMEKYISSKLYFRMYNVRPDENRDNTILQGKWERLVTLPASQLDALPEVESHHVWGQAMFELDGMNFFKTPREKLRCGMRACELLSLAVGDILEKRRRDKRGEGSSEGTGTGASQGGGRRDALLAFGADEFLPCFLLLVLRAQPYNYSQNVAFINMFRSPDLMSAEESYCLANLLSSCEFWLRCDDNGRMTSTPRDARAYAQRGGVGTEGGRMASAATAAVAPPQLFEDDLLPSVKHTRQAGTATAQVSAATTAPSAMTPAPTVLDTLFGWMSNVTHAGQHSPTPAASAETAEATAKAGRAGTPSTAGSPPPPPLGKDTGGLPSPSNYIEQWRRGARGPRGSSAQSAPAAHTLLGADTPAAERAGATAVTGLSLDTPLAGVPVASQTSAAKVRHILITQNKPFEVLSISELQLIVEEMRRRLQDGTPSR